MTDTHFIPDELATRTARLINEAEDMRAQAVDDLKTIYGDLREELKALGWLGQNISKEVAAFRAAISEMRLDEEQKAKREEKGDRIDDYVALLSRSRAGARARTREGNAYADAKLVETVAAGVQTEVGRAALIAAVDIMIAREEAQETQERPSTNDEASPEAGPQAEASPAGTGAGTLADREGRREGEAASVGLPTSSEFPSDERETDREAADTHAGANAGGEDVDGSAERASSVATSSGPDAKRASNSPATATEMDRDVLRGDEIAHAVPAENARKAVPETEDGSVSHAGAGESPATNSIGKSKYVLRPHCLNPGESCGGYSTNHCHPCLKALRESEKAEEVA